MKINTKQYEPVIKEVLIDDREVARKDYAMEQYAPFNPHIEHLPFGDYIFKGNGISVCFEYKTGSDFLTSIDHQNNHLHNQIYHMIQEFDYTFVVIECQDIQKQLDKLYYSTGLTTTLAEINGAISEFNLVTTVVHTQTQYQAFDFMMRQAGKIIQEKPFMYKFTKKTGNPALNYLSSIHGIETKAENICNTLNIRTHHDLMNVNKEDLMSVDLIGDKTADKILFELGYRREEQTTL